MNDIIPENQWIVDTPIPAALVSYIYRATQRKFAQSLSDYNLGWGHFAILMILYEKEGRSQDELASSRGFDKTMIAHSMKKLEEMGLLYRIVDERDKRVRRLFLTESGRRLCPELEEIGININKKLLKNFTNTETKKFLDYLCRVALNAADM